VKPLCIDLYCGLGGWAEGFLAEGYDVTGFDIEAHDYGTGSYPGELILRDVRGIHGSELKDATCIVGSSPCQEFSYRAMPWKRAKALPPPYLGMTLFWAQFRIQREASEAAGHHIPMVVENVRGAQQWVGRAQWHYGSYYLWGDVPALMPMTFQLKAAGKNWNEWKDWDGTEENKPASVRPWGDSTKNDGSGWLLNGCLASNNRMVSDGRKVSMNFHEHEKTGKPGRSFQSAAVAEMGCKGIPHRTAGHCTNPAEHEGVKQSGISGIRENGKGDRWFQDGAARHGSKSNSRKAASAMIAKIPFPLANHIAKCFKPEAQ
jgi:hypothetical protein